MSEAQYQADVPKLLAGHEPHGRCLLTLWEDQELRVWIFPNEIKERRGKVNTSVLKLGKQPKPRLPGTVAEQ